MKNLPYLALYTKDFSTSQKIHACSASTIGIYILLMCEMHRSPIYGCLVIPEKKQQKDSQKAEEKQSKCIQKSCQKAAKFLERLIGFSHRTIQHALEELIENEVIYFDNNMLCQKRMIRDAKRSEILSESGVKGYKAKLAKNAKQNKNEEDNEAIYTEIRDIENTKDIEKKEGDNIGTEAQASLEYEYAIENEIKSKERESREGGITETACVPHRNKTSKTMKLGENVSLTEEEHRKLCEKFGSEQTRKMIEILDNYKGANGKRYKSDYRAILSWVVEKYEKDTKYQLYANNPSQKSLRAAQSDAEFQQFIYAKLNADN